MVVQSGDYSATRILPGNVAHGAHRTSASAGDGTFDIAETRVGPLELDAFRSSAAGDDSDMRQTRISKPVKATETVAEDA